jgi:anti-anti-sigma regulatory factor
MKSTPLPPDPALPDSAILLPTNGTTVAAEDLQVSLVLAADRHAPFRIDASAVENVGQAVLQLLVAARAEAAANDLDFAIVAPSEAFLARVRACRLAEPLGLAQQEEQIQ